MAANSDSGSLELELIGRQVDITTIRAVGVDGIKIDAPGGAAVGVDQLGRAGEGVEGAVDKADKRGVRVSDLVGRVA